MELADRNHKETHGDWLGEAVRVLRRHAPRRSTRQTAANPRQWGNRLVRYL